jgi:hypothetical protein
MTTTLDRMVRAMQSSPAWPAVFEASSARTLIVAALKEAREPDKRMGDELAMAEQCAAYASSWGAGCIVWRAGIDHILGDEG